MPQWEIAAISLGKLIGLMDATGSFQWTWFLDPKTNTFQGIALNREHIGLMLRALRDLTAGDSPYYDQPLGLRWEALSPVDGAGIGFVWNENKANPLQLGMGASAAIPIATHQLTLSALGRMLRVTTSGVISTEFGQVRFAAGFPAPDFLEAGTLAGEYTNAFTFSLSVSDPNIADVSKKTRTFAFPTTAIPWDVARLAIFVLRAFLRQKAIQSPPGPPKNFFRRVDDHVFPMLGDPQPNPIAPFPLLADAMGAAPVFDTWHQSILTTDENGSGALTFLWHLRALITGNTSPDVLPGSRYLPLISGLDQPAGTPPPAAFNVTGSYPPNPPVAGAWLGIRAGGGGTELVLDLRNGAPEPAGVQTIVLLRRVGATFTQPPLPAGAGWTTLASFIQSLSPLNVGAGQITFDAGSGRLKLITGPVAGTGIPGMDGNYSLELVLRDNAPVAYRMETPLVGMELPPNPSVDDAKALFEKLVNWVVASVTPANAGAVEPVVKAIAALAISQIKTGSIDPKTLFNAVSGAISTGAGIEFGPLTIGVNNGKFTPAIEFGPLTPEKLGTQGISYSIGKIKVGATVNLLPPVSDPVEGFSIQILDLRLGTGSGTTGSGLAASIIPDMRDMPGFMLKAGFEGGKIVVEGGGKIPIQKTIGPLDVVALLIEIREKSLSVGLDLSFQLSVIKITVYELGIRFNFDKAPEVFLHGMGLSFDGGGIKLAGMFAEVTKPNLPPDYVGGAVVSVLNMFQLSAIGAYTEVDGEASLFIFASLVAPLGGTPWFFVTGIAGGFGYNRALPPSTLMAEHPFIKVMRGEIPMGSGDAASLAKISGLFAAQPGSYWIAAGIQFTSFGFINGKVIVSIQFGNKFSFNILGLASFGISPVAYFELALSITADEEKFLLIAGLSKNSYIIDPEIFSLSGDFGLGIWYASPNAGDFILSIGGYHPYFQKPEHYPELNRVGVKCVVWGFVRMSVEAFFALTPQALMAGVSVSLSAEFEGIGAGLDVYIDVFITWDPFFLRARMGVCVWFEFLGRHEIGVDLDIWTPEFGGEATIDLAIVSFTVSFGAPLKQPPKPRLDQFVTKQLGVEADRGQNDAAIVQYFSTSDNDAGLFKLDITWGRTTKKQSESAKQEGLDAPVPVNAEFGFTMRTRMPIQEIDAPTPPVLPMSGDVDLPLCGLENLTGTLSATGSGINLNKARMERMGDFYPVASFGDALDAAQADESGARAAVAGTSSKEPVIAMTDGIAFHCEAIPAVPPADLVGLSEEDSQADEEYPLPLAADFPLPLLRGPKSQVLFKNAVAAAAIKPKVNHIGRQQVALSQIQSRSWGPLFVDVFLADIQRVYVGARFKGLTYGVVSGQAADRIAKPIVTPPKMDIGGVVAPPKGDVGRIVAPVKPGTTPVDPKTPGPAAPAPASIPVPQSPRRRPEMMAVNLRIVPPKAAIAIGTGRLETLSGARNFSRKSLTPQEGLRKAFTHGLALGTGQAMTLQLKGGRPLSQRIAFSGTQTVRAIFQGGGEDVIADQYITGSASMEVPKRARRITVIGEGMFPPILNIQAATTGAAVGMKILEAIGVEHDSTVLALGRSTFAAHGCIVVANTALPFTAKAMDSVPGFQLLRGASNFNIHWPAVPKGSLVLTVEPLGDEDPSGALDEIRWATIDAEARGLSTVAGPRMTALVMDLAAPVPWKLEIDLGHKWRLTGAAVMQRSARDMGNWLRARNVWDLVDDRLQRSSEEPATKIAVEVKQ